MKFKTLLSVSALSIATFIGSAQAAIIPALEFTTDSGWMADGVNSSTKRPYDNHAYDCAAGATKVLNGCGLVFSGSTGIAGGYTDVKWGSGSGWSGLNIASKSGILVANGGWVQTGLITHTNKVVSVWDATLVQLDLQTIFSIVNPPLGSAGATVGIKFNETSNNADLSKCPTPQLSTTGCDDTFTIKLNLPAIKFNVGGENYTIKFKLNPLQGITEYVTNPDGSIVLVTQEDSINQLELLARLEVPAPATLAIMGLGLIGLSIRRRYS